MDRQTLRRIAATVAEPKDAPADSFVLHAPLELLARVLLLDRLAATGPVRDDAVARIVELADRYAAAGDGVGPAAPYEATSVAEGCDDLAVAIAKGDLDRVDAVAAWLDTHATPAELRRGLADAVLPSLAAAGHAPILLALLPRVAALGVDLGTNLLRSPCRELARNPDWRLSWFDEPGDDPGGDPGGELDLLDVPRLGVPGSDFIFPVMHQAEVSGVAAAVLAPLREPGVDGAALARQLALVASWSMLQEPDTYVPYGWTHCLTMPQADLALAADARPGLAALVAATHLVGFRSALGTVALSAVDDAAVDVPEGVDAAALAVFGATHDDAHVVKHTLAALDAAAADPGSARTHLAAGARLAAWWGGRFA